MIDLVMNKHFPGFVSGEWIFDRLRKYMPSDEINLFLIELPWSKIQPYVLLGMLQLTKGVDAPARDRLVDFALEKFKRLGFDTTIVKRHV